MGRRLRNILATFCLGTSLFLSNPQIISAQDLKGDLSVKINKLSTEEAKNRVNFIAFEISKLLTAENPEKEYLKIEKELSELFQQTDNREVEYNANFLMSRLIFEKDKRTFTETFDFLEKCVFEYPEQEKQFGLTYNALQKIGDNFSKEGRLVGTVLCYELSNHSTYPQKDLSRLKRNLDTILNTEIGNLSLKEALRKMFDGDRIEAIPSYLFDNRYMKNFTLFRGDYLAPIPEGFGAALNIGPKKRLDKIKIEINPKSTFPNLEIKDVEISLEKNNPNALFVCDRKWIDAKDYINRESIEPQLNGRSQEYRYAKCEEIAKELSLQRSIAVMWDDIYDYVLGGAIGRSKKIDGLIYPLFLRERVKIKDILKMGGIDPYNWFYKGIIPETKSLNDLNW